ncbi:carbohydrate ABC transporter permease [Kineococcus glutinatus]|uniref:Carbohydrate ABC transporter permease n=1 Tax=Kineococcus glutinatus TaxID=1070872 RepID=A0ABP9HVC2_9ACTN
MSTATSTTTATAVAAPQGRQPARARRQKGAVARSAAVHLVSIAVLVVVLYPGVWMIVSSFKPTNEIVGDASLWPSSASFDNYRTALGGIGGISAWTFAWNSLLLAVLSVVGTVLSSAVTAYAFARIEFAGKRLWFALMIGTLLLPFHVLIIPQYIVFQKLDLVNTYVPLLVGKFLAGEAFFVFLMVQFMRNLPRELDEAARIDGCGHVRIFTSIMVPLLRPAIISSSIFAFIWSWNDFLGPLLYLNDPNKYPLPLALRLFVDQTSVSDYGAMIAMSVLALLPVLLFFLLFQRFLVEGVATQGLKG